MCLRMLKLGYLNDRLVLIDQKIVCLNQIFRTKAVVHWLGTSDKLLDIIARLKYILPSFKSYPNFYDYALVLIHLLEQYTLQQ